MVVEQLREIAKRLDKELTEAGNAIGQLAAYPEYLDQYAALGINADSPPELLLQHQEILFGFEGNQDATKQN